MAKKKNKDHLDGLGVIKYSLIDGELEEEVKSDEPIPCTCAFVRLLESMVEGLKHEHRTLEDEKKERVNQKEYLPN